MAKEKNIYPNRIAAQCHEGIAPSLFFTFCKRKKNDKNLQLMLLYDTY